MACGVLQDSDAYSVALRKDYEDGVIPEGIDPDIVRTEKQLDFEEAWVWLSPGHSGVGVACACSWQVETPWQGLPARYAGPFAARFTTLPGKIAAPPV